MRLLTVPVQASGRPPAPFTTKIVPIIFFCVFSIFLFVPSFGTLPYPPSREDGLLRAARVHRSLTIGQLRALSPLLHKILLPLRDLLVPLILFSRIRLNLLIPLKHDFLCGCTACSCFSARGEHFLVISLSDFSPPYPKRPNRALFSFAFLPCYSKLSPRSNRCHVTTPPWFLDGLRASFSP